MLAALLLLSLVGPQAAPPRASFTVSCAGVVCKVDGSKSTAGSGGRIALYRWTWGDGRWEVHATPTATNTWKPGKWTMKLVVIDSSGKFSAPSQKTVTLPVVPKTPPPAKVDTVVRVDTIKVQVLRVDTLIQHDTLGLLVTLPQPLPGSTTPFLHVDSLSNAIGNPTHVYLFVMIGTIYRKPDGSVEAYRPSVAVPNVPSSMSLMALKSQGVYPTLAAAVNALHAPAPPGWVP